MQDIINFISDVPRLLIIFGLVFIFLGFVDKIGGFLEVSPIYKKFTVPVGIVLLIFGFFMQNNTATVSTQKPTQSQNSTQTTKTTQLISPRPNMNTTPSALITKNNKFSNNGVYNENYTRAKKGTLVINENWAQEWKKYASIYEDFVKLPANKGYKILNSPNSNDIYQIRNESDLEASGYIKTNNGIFYFTQYSFQSSKSPKFIELIN